MKHRVLIVCLLCALILAACKSGDAVSTQPAAEAVEAAATAQATVKTPAPTPEATAQPKQQLIIDAVTSAPTEVPVTPAPTPEPTAEPTPVPTDTPVPKLGVLDGKFKDKFVTGKPVLTSMSYQSERLAIFIERVVDESKTISKHTYVYYVADVYFQNMEDFRSAAAKSWEKIWDNDWLVNVAKAQDAIFAVSGDFTLTRKEGLVIRNGELLLDKHDTKRDVGVVYLDGHMETYLKEDVPVEELLNDPNVWQILGFGPELLDANGEPKTVFNDPNKVGHENIRNAVGYYEPGHYCFVYVQPYKTRSKSTCLTLECLSKLMYQLGCVKAYNLDGGATAGMYFNGKLVSDKGLGQSRKIHDFYYIPKV